MTATKVGPGFVVSMVKRVMGELGAGSDRWGYAVNNRAAPVLAWARLGIAPWTNGAPLAPFA